MRSGALRILSLAGTLIFALFAISDASPDESFQPNVRPVYHVARLKGEIRIDGRLNDSGWQGLPRASNFTEQFPDNGARPPAQTEVMLTYDEDNLYIAFICYDPDASSIRSSWSDRDNIWSDDYMGMIFDTYGAGSWGYEIFVNPLGLQGDGLQVTSVGEDIGFDVIFESRGTVTDSCYQTEIALPFASIRFPDKPIQEWKATFWRTRPRESRSTSSWAFVPDDANCWMCEFGTLTGIENVKSGKNIELLPSVIGFQSAAIRDPDNRDSGLKNENLDGEASLGMRYSITSGMSAEATINPDFSQVESDAAQIDVNETFALFYPEKRPFFQEGSDLFSGWIDAVYTRSINNPDFAAKLIGRMGSTSLAYLGARDEDSPIIIPLEERSELVDAHQSYSNIVRFKKTFGGSAHIGGLLSDRRLKEGGSNTDFGVDFNLPFLKLYRFEAQGLASHTTEPSDTTLTADIDQVYFDNGKHTVAFDGESFWGHAAYLNVQRSARFWSFDIDLLDYSPAFRADNGFVTKNGFRQAEAWTGVNFYPDSKILDNIEIGENYARVWNPRGGYRDGWAVSYVDFLFKAQTSLDITHTYTREVFGGVHLPAMNRLAINLNSGFSEPVQAGIGIAMGEYIARNEEPPVLGDGVNLGAEIDLKPYSRLKIVQTYDFSTLRRQDNDQELFRGFIYRNRINYQFTRELFLRLIVQYNDFGENLQIDPLLSYKLNPFTIFYIGSTHNYEDIDNSDHLTPTSRQFFAKFQYLLRM